ncbi:MAG: hypothetical protein CFH01_00824 [Alphaproteobacteria bacterium MarineAlpha2_Bin1]|nr:MAG: hypothetical protein CFH01_00824 [Alphaproteobacteria bacterium MarineAlpha2_Bin1]|tara:strand:+ start:981 stop:1373 length:393 start_codon:yes stop_codon:yes gene_type:complete
MTTENNNFLKLEEIIFENIRATIFHNDTFKNFQTGIIFKAESSNFNTISSQALSFYFVKLMNININRLSDKICYLVSQSIKFTNDIDYNKFFISKSEITKKTKNLVFLKTHFLYNDSHVIAFSNSIWKIN